MKLKIKMIYGIVPVPVFYVENIGKEEFPAGRSYGLWVLIKNKYETDTGLLAHELVHCEQFWKPPFIRGLFYKFHKPTKYQMELEAYIVQLEHVTGLDNYLRLVDKFAWFITNRYNLDVDIHKVKEDLLNK